MIIFLIQIYHLHPKKISPSHFVQEKSTSYFPLYWLVNRDPSIGLLSLSNWYNPHLYIKQLNHQVFVALLIWFLLPHPTSSKLRIPAPDPSRYNLDVFLTDMLDFFPKKYHNSTCTNYPKHPWDVMGCQSLPVLRVQGCHERRVWCFNRRGQECWGIDVFTPNNPTWLYFFHLDLPH